MGPPSDPMEPMAEPSSKRRKQKDVTCVPAKKGSKHVPAKKGSKDVPAPNGSKDVPAPNGLKQVPAADGSKHDTEFSDDLSEQRGRNLTSDFMVSMLIILDDAPHVVVYFFAI